MVKQQVGSPAIASNCEVLFETRPLGPNARVTAAYESVHEARRILRVSPREPMLAGRLQLRLIGLAGEPVAVITFCEQLLVRWLDEGSQRLLGEYRNPQLPINRVIALLLGRKVRWYAEHYVLVLLGSAAGS